MGWEKEGMWAVGTQQHTATRTLHEESVVCIAGWVLLGLKESVKVPEGTASGKAKTEKDGKTQHALEQKTNRASMNRKQR